MMKALDLARALTLPSVSLESLSDVTSPSIWLEPTVPKRKFLRRAPFAHHDPDQVRLFPSLQTAEINYPPLFVMGLPHVKLVGFRSFIYEDTFFIDEPLHSDGDLERHNQKLDHDNEHRNERTGFRKLPDSAQFTLQNPGKKEITVDEPVFVLSSDEPENYGSFIFRVLPKLITYRYSGLDSKIIAPTSFTSMSRLLEICGINASRLVSHDTRAIYNLRHAIIPSVRNPHAFLDEVTLGLFDEIRTRVKRTAPEVPGRLIYVSRENLGSTKSGYRAMRNATEVRAALETMGFKTIHPEAMTADEQICAFSSASIVVGQSGGAMFNAAFCRPGTFILDIESEPHWIHAHMSFFSSLNLRYIIFEARAIPQEGRTIHLPFDVNVSALVETIRNITSERLHDTHLI